MMNDKIKLLIEKQDELEKANEHPRMWAATLCIADTTGDIVPIERFYCGLDENDITADSTGLFCFKPSFGEEVPRSSKFYPGVKELILSLNFSFSDAENYITLYILEGHDDIVVDKQPKEFRQLKPTAYESK